ncbi:hypothetical protein K440DRAFT_101737 [Wilcoxina mikolae CBS 423.85]|nr:hypothetical protein K440DRAFT_101737 [Wilcoxina mikolae CBS 423.85]
MPARYSKLVSFLTHIHSQLLVDHGYNELPRKKSAGIVILLLFCLISSALSASSFVIYPSPPFFYETHRSPMQTDIYPINRYAAVMMLSINGRTGESYVPLHL